MEEAKKNPLEDQLTMSLIIQGALAAMPDLPKMYPKIVGGIDMLEKGIDSFLEDGKMVVVTKKNGVTMAIVLNTNVPFSLTNEMKMEAEKDPVIGKYEKSEYKEKLLSSMPMQVLKERYEKMGGAEATTDNGFLSGLLSKV